MLEKRKGRGGGSSGGGGSPGIEDNWVAPPLVKAQMAFEIIWFCIILYLITLLVKAIRNVPSRQRQPYILLLVSAIFLDICLITRAIAIRIDDVTSGPPSLALRSVVTLLWQQPIALITMAGLWVFRERSQLLIYGEGATGIPYAGQMKFVVDWTVTSCGLVFLLLVLIVNAEGYSLYWNDVIGLSEYLRYYDAQIGLLFYVLCAFYFILTIIFIVTGFTLSAAFKRQMGKPDVVRRFPTRLRIPVNFDAGHSSDANLGHALAYHSYARHPS